MQLKPLLITLTFLFCIKPIQTNAVSPDFVLIEYKDSGCFVEDSKGESELKRLTIDDVEGML